MSQTPAPEYITKDDENTIFVFGSNLAGRHGKGAALTARLTWGAKTGVGSGLTGRAYALPTKDAKLNTLPLSAIAVHVKRFTAFATYRTDLVFMCTRVGTGLAGYSDRDVAPLFAGAARLGNVYLPANWLDIIAASKG